jgi:hypothetical protein
MKTLVATFVLSALTLGLFPAPTAKADEFKINPDRYGAIAFSPKTKKYGYAWNYSTREGAEKAALSEVKEDDAKNLTWVKFGWAVLVIAEDGAYGYDVVYGDGVTDGEAITKATKQLRKHSEAKIVTTVIVCSGDIKPKVITK